MGGDNNVMVMQELEDCAITRRAAFTDQVLVLEMTYPTAVRTLARDSENSGNNLMPMACF